MRAQYYKHKDIFPAIIIIVLILAAWSGLPNKISADYTNDAMLNTGVAYASARTINALISTFQTAQVSVGFASISVGELLDPINDLIERFSSVMVWCLGSIALQKILIASVATNVFQVAFTLVGVAACLELFFKDIYRSIAMKVFVIFAALRFGLFVVLLLNGAFESVFLKAQIVDSQRQIDNFRSELSIFESEIPDTISNDIENAVALLDRLKANKAASGADLTRISETLNDDTARLDTLQESISTSIWPWGGSELTEEEMANAKNKIALLTAEIRSFETFQERTTQDIESFTEQIATQEESVACLQKKEKGGSCSWSPMDYVPSIGLSAIKSFEKTFKTTLQSIIRLLVALLMQSIILPLLFLWLVKYGVVYLWRSIFSSANENMQKGNRGSIVKAPPTGPDVI